jgi:hypothetical protein
VKHNDNHSTGMFSSCVHVCFSVLCVCKIVSSSTTHIENTLTSKAVPVTHMTTTTISIEMLIRIGKNHGLYSPSFTIILPFDAV